jgi:hypothetical protein
VTSYHRSWIIVSLLWLFLTICVGISGFIHGLSMLFAMTLHGVAKYSPYFLKSLLVSGVILFCLSSYRHIYISCCLNTSFSCRWDLPIHTMIMPVSKLCNFNLLFTPFAFYWILYNLDYNWAHPINLRNEFFSFLWKYFVFGTDIVIASLYIQDWFNSIITNSVFVLQKLTVVRTVN